MDHLSQQQQHQQQQHSRDHQRPLPRRSRPPPSSASNSQQPTTSDPQLSRCTPTAPPLSPDTPYTPAGSSAPIATQPSKSSASPAVPTSTTDPPSNEETFASIISYDDRPFSARDDAWRSAEFLREMAQIIGDSERQFQMDWTKLLSLPLNPYSISFRIPQGLNLKRVTFEKGCLNLKDFAYRTLIDEQEYLSGSSSDAQGRRSARRAAKRRFRAIRMPDLSWKASYAVTVGVEYRYLIAGTAAVKAEPEHCKAGLLLGIVHAALVHSIMGASLGLSVYRASFARVFALSDTVVAVDDFRRDGAVDRVPDILGADDFLAFFRRLSNRTLAERLPFTFANEADTAATLDVLGRWSHAAVKQLLPQPRAGPFTRLRPGQSVAVELLEHAETIYTDERLRERKQPPRTSPSRSRKRKLSSPSAADAGSSQRRRTADAMPTESRKVVAMATAAISVAPVSDPESQSRSHVSPRSAADSVSDSELLRSPCAFLGGRSPPAVEHCDVDQEENARPSEPSPRMPSHASEDSADDYDYGYDGDDDIDDNADADAETMDFLPPATARRVRFKEHRVPMPTVPDDSRTDVFYWPQQQRTASVYVLGKILRLMRIKVVFVQKETMDQLIAEHCADA